MIVNMTAVNYSTEIMLQLKKYYYKYYVTHNMEVWKVIDLL